MKIVEIKIVKFELDCVRISVVDSEGRFVTVRRPLDEDAASFAQAIRELAPDKISQLKKLDIKRG